MLMLLLICLTIFVLTKGKNRLALICLVVFIFAIFGCRQPTRTEMVMSKAQRVWKVSKKYAEEKWDESGDIVEAIKKKWEER